MEIAQGAIREVGIVLEEPPRGAINGVDVDLQMWMLFFHENLSFGNGMPSRLPGGCGLIREFDSFGSISCAFFNGNGTCLLLEEHFPAYCNRPRED
jgi:hypothetical protein